MTLNYTAMRDHKQLAISCLAVTAFVMGCKPSAGQERKATAGQLDKVKKETKEAGQDRKDYALAYKEESVAKEMASQ